MGTSDSKFVLWFTPWFPSRVHSTLGNFIERHAHVAGLEADVEVIHFTTEPTDSCIIKPIEKQGLNGIHIFKPSGLKGWCQLIMIIISQLNRKKPAIIHLNIFHESWWIALIARIICPNSVIFCSEHWTGYHNGAFEELSWWRRKAIGLAASLVDIFLPVTRHLGHSMQDTIKKNISFQILPNVVDDKIFTFCPEKDLKYTFLHVSTLDFNHKRPDVILRSFARLVEEFPQITLAIGGDGDVRPLKQLASRLGVEHLVTFFGEKTSPEIAALMQESAYLVLYSKFENFPCVIAEAWMCGVPVIASDVGGIAEWLIPETGILINPKEESELYEAMKKVVTGEICFDRFQIAKYATEHFSYGALRMRLHKLYTQHSEQC